MTNLDVDAVPKQKSETKAGSQFFTQLEPFVYPGVSEASPEGCQAAQDLQATHGSL